MSDEHQFLLQRVQPAMVGLIDGSLSTLAPIFAIALASHNPRYAFIAGLATSLGAAVSMGFSEALSDTGELTGRGSPIVRGSITGGGTFLGGILHTLPFLIPHYHAALFSAIGVVGFELMVLAYLRWRFFGDTFVRALGIVTFAGIVIAALSAGLGSLLGNPGAGETSGRSTSSVSPSTARTCTRSPAEPPRARQSSPFTRTQPSSVITPVRPTSASAPTAGRRRCDQRHQNHASPSSIAPPPATATTVHGSSRTKTASRTAATRAIAAGRYARGAAGS
jgi:erythrin-vacuolar iron transport family protein